MLLLVRLVVLLNFLDCLTEALNHNGRGHGSKEHEDWAENPFGVALRVKVSEAHSWERGEGIIRKTYNIFLNRLELQLILCHKVASLLRNVVSQPPLKPVEVKVADDVPEKSNEVARARNYHNVSKDPNNVRYDHDVWDFWIFLTLNFLN